MPPDPLDFNALHAGMLYTLMHTNVVVVPNSYII